MEAATVSQNARSEFQNVSDGNIGVTLIDNGKEKAIALKPNEKVLMTSQEQILTANAPLDDKDNPFVNGALKLITPAKDIANRRPVGDPSSMPGAVVDAPSEEEAEKARLAKQAEAKRIADEEAERTAKAKAQGAQGAQPRVARPPAKSEAEGAVADPKAAPVPEETATPPQPASEPGERAAAEEVATPDAEPEK